MTKFSLMEHPGYAPGTSVCKTEIFLNKLMPHIKLSFPVPAREVDNKPNHGFRIMMLQYLMRFIFLLAYADIFLSFSMDIRVTARMRKHTLRNLPNAYHSGEQEPASFILPLTKLGNVLNG